MRKALSLIMAIAMVFALCACGQQAATTEAAPAEAEEAATTEAAAATEEPITLTIAVPGNNPDSVLGEGTAHIEEYVEQVSGGLIQVETFYATELGNIPAQIEGVFDGTIDLVVTGPSYISGYVPECQVFDLPMLFENYDEVHATLDGEPGQYIASLFEGSGVKLLNYFDSGLRCMTNSTHQIHSMADCAGVKIRVAPSETQLATWEGFGAIPMALSADETYTALQQGTIDAQENGLTWIYGSKVYETQKYLSLTYHSYTSMPIIFNEANWAALTSQQQEWIIEGVKMATDWQRQATQDAEAEIIENIEEYGLEVERNPDRDSFKDSCQGAYDVFNTAVGSEDVLKMVQDYIAGLR